MARHVECSNPAAFGCTADSLPIQLKDHVLMQELNIDTGQYETKYTMSTSFTSPAYTRLNGADISGIDGIAYGSMTVSGTDYLVRYDNQDVHFLGLMRSASAGTIDRNGDYWYVTGKKTYKVTRPDQVTGSATTVGSPNYRDPNLLSYTTNNPKDITAWKVDLLSAGTTQDWLIGLEGTSITLLRTDSLAAYALTLTGDTLGASQSFGHYSLIIHSLFTHYSHTIHSRFTHYSRTHDSHTIHSITIHTLFTHSRFTHYPLTLFAQAPPGRTQIILVTITFTLQPTVVVVSLRSARRESVL